MAPTGRIVWLIGGQRFSRSGFRQNNACQDRQWAGRFERWMRPMQEAFRDRLSEGFDEKFLERLSSYGKCSKYRRLQDFPIMGWQSNWPLRYDVKGMFSSALLGGSNGNDVPLLSRITDWRVSRVGPNNHEAGRRVRPSSGADSSSPPRGHMQQRSNASQPSPAPLIW
jgi:hypothetical protein